MKYSILIWNIHGADGFSSYQMPNFVLEKILYEDKDFVVITEFIRNSQWSSISRKLAKKYWRYTYQTKSNNKNEVLILVKKNLSCIEKYNAMKSLKPKMLPPQADNPNFLEIELLLNDERTLYIIGVRIRDDNHTPQFKILVDYLNTLPKDAYIICGGDFNEWANPIGQKIKSLTVHTPYYYSLNKNDYFQSLSTWSAILKDKYGKYGKAIIDHVLTKNVSDVLLNDYLWDFVNSNNGYGKIQSDGYKSDLKYLPDHGILIGELTI